MRPKPNIEKLAAAVVGGHMRAAARACRIVDDASEGYLTLLKALYPRTGQAWTIGVTGTPGAGKSTLTDKLITSLRQHHDKVAVIAIDPTSPFSGGAILGDRIRMQRHFEDPGVFIRSLATRGALGGLSRSAPDLVRVMDAWGAGVVIVETVGVGQDELEVARTVDATMVVMAPGMGDDVQAIKAGIVECADVFAVNKADREGAHATVRDLQLMIALGHATRAKPKPAAAMAGHHGYLGGHAKLGPQGKCGKHDDSASGGVTRDGDWEPPILQCIATTGQGIDALVAALQQHRQWLNGSAAGKKRRQHRLAEALHNHLRNALIDVADTHMGEAIAAMVAAVGRREIDPYTASEQLIAQFRK
ncbi:MAG TPA: methylmalonyl Co-A mutase-associated GTPase MeaB, partial [Sorangium sp.]|nr:methylmalonyl Co-A mutase-associated GTPase MeaB [Sorangium sp.]